MKMISGYQNKNILVLGLAKSGTATAMLLHKLGAKVIVNDLKPLEENPQAKMLQEHGIEVVCGGHPLSIFDEKIEVVFKNPGIPYSNPILIRATELNIPILTEVELAYEVSEAPFIGITGSNGKTTTTTLIFEMLQQDNKNPLIAGNIGTVAVEVAQQAKQENIIVTELSSFQLMGISKFQPKISVLLNLFEAHLDFHGTMLEYAQAKGKISENQTADDYVVYNYDDMYCKEMIKSSNATLIPFSTKDICENGAYLLNDSLYFQDEEIIPIKDIVLPGKHNIENILAAIAVCKLYSVKNEAIRKVLATFTGVKHRLQYVSTVQERRFYNDSKATNILATQKALSAFEEPVILLAGGLDRGNEFDELIPYLKNVKTLITFGQTAEKLEKAGMEAGIPNIERVANVEKAVQTAMGKSTKGDVILLSPACASWDQYKTFEERGDIFINAVHMLK
ncbi:MULTISPECIES: UDP-N-acetylmuramoyl-L-alanine--D-glutamate ligase [Sutcliffiella]|uniref:UDP-N-acetylmuramoylalanine--D-glutamate ligase n=1 Tax=Sutcliffiella cohnii TaxID=33932 RepID=A0A223KS15_9BACI|nr:MULTISPECIES: UDP-N-acetylmuramoyl-L-alanine--D-glutamate ligase [Sutcliffiella]AST92144.1 UDP-N-acetylmuramoyl-L-alanine--D-glutamate ligase [Sutcliffiella cohnii]MED4015430.1 UDP-N-acetylmuramoyl-L-alanine--D-glutamate ligase [Sutcliffiella cohnii]WBL13376.1 UDP-N-acetylmuramoyl-L-alanine--D-glutamate ligase [Sutcliffiella sp. NC1]